MVTFEGRENKMFSKIK